MNWNQYPYQGPPSYNSNTPPIPPPSYNPAPYGYGRKRKTSENDDLLDQNNFPPQYPTPSPYPQVQQYQNTGYQNPPQYFPPPVYTPPQPVSYEQMPPVNYGGYQPVAFQPLSRSGKKKALLIGINYLNDPKCRLRGNSKSYSFT
jgi:hypothetical protein